MAPVNITVPPGGSGRFDCTAKAATTPQITITKKDQTTEPDLDVSSGIIFERDYL
jgi:hypothetical protein